MVVRQHEMNISIKGKESRQTTPWFIAIGASGAEGLHDIQELLAAFPGSLAAVVLIVLHRPWDRPTHLRSILARVSKLPVIIAAKGEHLQAGTVYIGEPAEHLTLAAKSFGELTDDPNNLYRNRTVDLLFRSLAVYGGSRIIGVVLSGWLDDGSQGLATIHDAGGLTMVLTPEGAWRRQGMPENAIGYDGPIDLIGDPRQIAAGICAAVRNQDEVQAPQPA